MTPCQSIRPHVLATLEREFPDLKKQFGIKQLRLFGPVSRGTDTAESEIDLLYIFEPEKDTYDNLFDLHEYLTNLLGRKIELVSEEWCGERFLNNVLRDAVSFAPCPPRALHEN